MIFTVKKISQRKGCNSENCGFWRIVFFVLALDSYIYNYL